MSTVWTSVDGSIRNFRAMDDEHLANVLLHLKHYLPVYGKSVIQEIYKEVEARGLSDTFLSGAPYPWKHKRTGVWYIWDFSINYVRKFDGMKE